MNWLLGGDRVARAMMATLAVLSTTAWARAEPPLPAAHAAPAAERARTVVLIHSRAPAGTEARLAENLRWQLTELDLALLEETAPSEPDLQHILKQAEQIASSGNVLLVTWIALAHNGTSIYLFDPKGPHLYARQVAVSGSPAAASEELALIVRSAVQAHIEGSLPAMPEIALPAAPTVRPSSALSISVHANSSEASSPKRQETAGTPLGWGAGIGSVVTRPFSNGSSQVGLAVRSWLRWRSLRMGIGYTTFPSLEIAGKGAAIAVYRHPLEALAALEWSIGRVTFVAESLLGLDGVQRDTTRVAAPLSARGSDARWLVTVGERLRTEVRIVGPVWLSLAGGVDVTLNPYTFEVASADQRITISEALQFRSGVEVGLVFTDVSHRTPPAHRTQ